jgi:hypothetical protein
LYVLEDRKSALDEDLRFHTDTEPKTGTVTFDEKGKIGIVILYKIIQKLT